ncbi:ROK family protein [Ornithinimicrobium pratense]|uniref:ROK family protein n=1 Tax=Ornithinimicrobium pratense TaxID=2593973 RepID=A0A5J6V7U4_9MICO|nr:ROK family protein [Ornithinimicrobium pratense]QFG69082.1 ROK family protein [Ornithinimicrobium pratense]
MSFQPTRRTGLNRTVLLSPGAPWHGAPAGRALGAASPLDDGQWLCALERLVATLVEPTPQDRAARPDWGEDDWARWGQLEQIVLCGGVLAGGRGDLVRSRFRAPGQLGLPAVPVEVETDPASASLRGLTARPPVDAPTLVLDLGHTAVKAAVATEVGDLGPVTRFRVPWTPFDLGTWPDPATLLGLVREAAAHVRSEELAVRDPAPVEARLAVANYVVDGQLDDDPTWGTLAHLGQPAAELLSQELGLPVRLLVNDGQAAAMGRAGQRHTAVITIGTSLGVGFPPCSAPTPQQRRSLSRD